MTKVIRERSGDVIAIIALLAFGLAVTVFILSRQQQPYPEWVPFLGDDTFEVRAEFSNAQAVTPGQGQTVNVAGIRVGDITDVTLDEGNAVVTMKVDQEHAPIFRSDATALLRPRTGLQDMTVEIQPGTPGAPPLEEGATIDVAGTDNNVQPDEILASLDRDTRSFLVLLLEGGARGLGGNGEQLSAALRRFEPTARDLARINKGLAERRENIARAISSFREVSEELGAEDTRLAEFVDSSDAALGGFASQEAAIRETLRELPSALKATSGALESGDRLALELGPAARDLIPSARSLGPALRESRPFFRRTKDPIEDQIRPFTREVRPAVRALTDAAGELGAATPDLTQALGEVNRLVNALAFNPPGAEEGYLFYVPWLNHNTSTMFAFQDAHGPLRRGIVLQSCLTAVNAEGLTATPGQELLLTLQDLTRVAKSADICPLDPP